MKEGACAACSKLSQDAGITRRLSAWQGCSLTWRQANWSGKLDPGWKPGLWIGNFVFASHLCHNVAYSWLVVSGGRHQQKPSPSPKSQATFSHTSAGIRTWCVKEGACVACLKLSQDAGIMRHLSAWQGCSLTWSAGLLMEVFFVTFMPYCG